MAAGVLAVVAQVACLVEVEAVVAGGKAVHQARYLHRAARGLQQLDLAADWVETNPQSCLKFFEHFQQNT